MKIAFVHDWLTGMRGGERVLEVFCEMYPAADIYTLFHIERSVSPSIESHRIYTSFLQKAPGIKKYYRYYLPLMPIAIRQFDLVISFNHCVAKGARVSKKSVHVCYCFTPMRYVWELRDQYFGINRGNFFLREVAQCFFPFLRNWDVSAAKRVDYFIATCRNVQGRIKRCYSRESEVIYSPIDMQRFSLSAQRDDYYLVVSAFAPYKRIDLAIKAFNLLGKSLKIVGCGQDEKLLKKIAGPTIEFLDWQPDNAVVELYKRCRAFIFPGEEDFGLTPLEAQACGRPVIAYAKGGALETVIDNETGIFFDTQTHQALADAVLRFESKENGFIPEKLRLHAQAFDKNKFQAKVKVFFDKILNNAEKV